MAYNPEVHENLIALGFEYYHYEEQFEECGCVESGPALDYTPAYDFYVNDEQDIEIAIEKDGSVHVQEHPAGFLNELREYEKQFEHYYE